MRQSTGIADSKIEIDIRGIGSAINSSKLAVPIYQRAYAWEDRHICELFDDITRAIENREPEYFLGSIVTTRTDGQQRLATITILLAAIRDYCHNAGDIARAGNIEGRYLYEETFEGLELIPKLRMNDTDNDFFTKRILATPDSPERAIEPSSPSHKRIEEASIYARNYIAKAASQPDPIKYLAELLKYIRDSVRVIWMAVSDDANAFTIFETLNDRGLSLAISDLLKNYLFGLAGHDIGEVQQRWQSMISNFEDMQQGDMIVTFIRHFWSSKHGAFRERDLYAHIKAHIHSRAEALSSVKELERNSRYYAAILNPGHEIWTKYRPDTASCIGTLRLLRMVQIRPLILAVMDRMSIPRAEKVIKSMVSWSVRLLIVRALGTGTYERYYSLCAKGIRNGTIRTPEDVSKNLSQMIPTDAVFKNAFRTAEVSTHYVARYYLRTLEREAMGQPDLELVPNEDAQAVNLEHILPQTLSPSWSHISEDEHSTLYKRLGNLALLRSRINTAAGNDGFEYKKSFYGKSDFRLTSNLSSYSEWNRKTIDKRQAELAELALKAWPLA